MCIRNKTLLTAVVSPPYNYAQNTSLTNSWLWNGLFGVFPDLTRIFGIYGGQYAPHNASWVQDFRNVGAESKAPTHHTFFKPSGYEG